MKGWNKAKIGDICAVGDGAHASLKRVAEGVPYLSSKNFTSSGLSLQTVDYISQVDYEKHFKISSKAVTRPLHGDVLLSIIGSLGAPYLYTKDDVFGLSSSVAIVRPNQDKLIAPYIYHWMRTELFQKSLRAIKSGSAQGFLSLKMVGSLPIIYPSKKSIQQKIASILSAYDDLIENNLKRIKLLEEIAQRTYEEWFVKFRVNGKELTIDEETGLPVGWELKKIGQFYKLGSGGTPSRKKQELYFDNGSVPWIRTQELKDCIIVEPEEKITEIGLKESSAKLFPAHTVLLAMYGNTIGKTAYLGIAASTNQACCAFLDERVYRSYYMHQYLLANKLEILRYRMGAAQENISQEIIKSIEITTPQETTLIQFGEIVEPQYKLITDLTRQNIFLKEARDILLPRLMSGEIDVEEMEMAGVTTK